MTLPQTTTPPALGERDLIALLDRAEMARLNNNALRFLLLLKLSTPEIQRDSPTPIASYMMLSTSRVSELGKELLQRKLITRDRSKKDDRKVIYKLTRKGKDYLETIRTGEKLEVIA